jgi:pimeloyl-ACP methyl ester carboxylesterase
MNVATPSNSSQIIPVAGARIAVRRRGTGVPVLCAHAIGHDGRDFDGLAERLEHAFQFVMLDWPGQGDSPDADGAVSTQRYGEILIGLLETLHLPRAILLGNSIGGGASIIAAAQHPQLVRGLVLCNTAGLVRPSIIARLFCRRKAKFFEQAERGVASFPEQFRRYYENLVLPLPAARVRREQIIATATKVGPIVRQAWLSFAEPQANLRPLAALVKCPVLIAWAKRDRVNRWAFSKAGAQLFPDRTIEMLPGGHSAFLEAPEEFDRKFLRWVRTLPG